MANYFAPAKGRSALFVLLIALMVCCMVLSATAGVSAKVTVEQGPNSNSGAIIMENKATAEGDYTVYNDKIAFTIAGESNNYWGMTKGSILDLAYVDPDLADSGYTNLTNDIEFLNDYWTATGGTLDCTIDTSKSTDDKAVIEVTTYWENGTAAKPLEVVITYTLEDGADYIGLSATSTNPADNDVAYPNMHSGFSITTLAASMFGPFGYYPDVKVTGIGIGADPDVQQPFGDFVVSYSKTYAVTLYVKDADCYKGSSGYKDLYNVHDIAPGDSYTYEGEVFVSPESETGTYLQHVYERESGTDFEDVTEDWYKDAVAWAVGEGITKGTSDTTFSPKGNCSRAEVVTFLYRAAGSPAIPEGTENPFTDLTQDWYKDAVLWAVSEGITTGTSATTFKPSGVCTRAEVATFLYRAAGEPEVAEDAENPFTDVADNAWYKDAVLWAVDKGITTGTNKEGTLFSPNVTCSRAQVVTFLYRAAGEPAVSIEHSVVSGKVTDAEGAPLKGAYVIAKANGKYQTTGGEVIENLQPFVWDIVDEEGAYSLDLPTGDYTIKVEAEGYTFAEKAITLSEAVTEDFALENGAPVKLTAVDEKGNKVPFKVTVGGVVTEMKTLGGAVQFSDAVSQEDPYSVEFTMPKGEGITFTASYGSDFESKVAEYETDVTEAGVEYEFTIPTLIDPQEDGWYCADNHQHSKFGDGATEPIDLYRAQVANKLDFSIVSDHDSRLYDMEIAGYSAVGGIKLPFIPSLEVSPGWGHWGMLNIDYATTPEQQADVNYTGNIVNPSATTPQEIITQGHNHHATVVANHPYTDYGFLNNQASLPTGNGEGWNLFDLVELQSTIDLSAIEAGMTADKWESVSMDNLGATVKALGFKNIDEMALLSAMAFWNEGTPKYLSAGSDQHDAHSTTLYPGKVREYALLGEEGYNVDNYMDVLKQGKAFVTTGPILIPAAENMYGDTKEVAAGMGVTLSLDATAVNGLSEVTLWKDGVPVDKKTFDASENTETVTFDIEFAEGAEDCWYSFTAADAKGGYAATNPIWFKIVSE